MPSDITLDGRTVLVTGGANGIGRACAVRLARAGAEVTVVDRDETTAKEVSAHIGGRAVAADLSDVDSLWPDDVVRQVMLAPAAIKRLIEPEEVADLVVYLCSPEGSFITGTSFMMDGGWSAH